MHEDLERLLRQLEPLVALEKADGLLAADPDDSAARSCRIRSLWMLRRADESRAELQQALAERGADDAAIQVARGVLALGLRDDLIHVGTAYRFSTVGRDDSAAEDSFRSALALEPSNVEARRGLATALRLAGRRDEALAVLKTAPMEIGPAVATLLVEQAWCEFDLWHLEGAVERLDRVLAINDTDLEALYAKAFVLRVATDEAATRAVLERIEKLTPTWRVHLETELGAQQAEALQFIDDPVRHAAASKAAISHLNTALRLLPDHPAAWAGHMLAEAGHDADKDRPGGPGGLMSSADARLASASYGHRHNYTSWEKKAQQALALYRQALAADPLLVYARSREAECLRLLNRLTEARQAAETVLDLVPQHGIALTILALIEVDAGQPERALDAALAARLCGAHVLPRVWIELGLSDEAEAAAGAEIKRVEHVDADVRFCLFYSAFSVKQYGLALKHAESLVENAPTVVKYRAWRAVTRRCYWRERVFGWRITSEPKMLLEKNRECELMVDAALPGALPLRLRGRLRSLVLEASKIDDSEVGGWLPTMILMLMTFGIAAAPWTRYFAMGGGADKLWCSLVALFGGVGVAYAASKVVQRWFIAPLRVLILLVGGMAGVAIWLGTDVRTVLVARLVAWAFGGAALMMTLIWSMIFAEAFWASRAATRLRRRDRHAALVNDLCVLLRVLYDDRPLATASARLGILRSLEVIADGQYHAMLETIGGSRSRLLSRETATDREFRHRAAGVAAATRDLKRSVLSPGPETWANLKARVIDLLEATVHGWWEQCPYRKPDPVTRVLLAKAALLARRAVAIGGVPAMVGLLQYSHAFKVVIPIEVKIGAYVVWPLSGLLMLVDSALLARIGAVSGLLGLMVDGDKKEAKVGG